MDDRDRDLEEILKIPRRAQATPHQIDAWRAAARKVRAPTKISIWGFLGVPQFGLGIVLGLAFGIPVSTLVTSTFVTAPASFVAENDPPSATIETVYVKAE